MSAGGVEEGIAGRDEVGLEETLGRVPGPTCLRDAVAPAMLNEGSNKYGHSTCGRYLSFTANANAL
jgi:hypothetical protein